MSHSSQFLSVDASFSSKTFSESIPEWLSRLVDREDEWIWKVVGIACGSLISYHFYQKFQQERFEKEEVLVKLQTVRITATIGSYLISLLYFV